jgi:hypothetical protein
MSLGHLCGLPTRRIISEATTLSWLVDAATEAAGADRVLAELGAHLLADGLPLAGWRSDARRSAPAHCQTYMVVARRQQGSH